MIYLSRVLCLSYSCRSVCRSCGTLSLCFSNQTDKGDETEGFLKGGIRDGGKEMEKLKREGVKRLFCVKIPT
jgi:hypothetical protein